MVNGAKSRKVEITLNSAVSHVPTLQPIWFWFGNGSVVGEVQVLTFCQPNNNTKID